MNPLIPVEHLMLLSVIITAVCGYLAWKSSAVCSKKVRLLIVFARVMTVLLLFIIALNLGHWRKSHQDNISKWCVLLDCSKSMRAVDQSEKTTRWDRARKEALDLLELSGSERSVDLYTFADKLTYVKDKSDAAKIKPEGEATDILEAIETVLNRYSFKENLRGIFLLSDGRQIPENDNREAALHALARDIPIYSIGFGGRLYQKDLEAQTRFRQQISFSGQTVKLKVIVSNKQLGDIIPAVQLRNADGQLIQEQKVSLKNNESAEVEFDMKTGPPGYYEYFFKVPFWHDEQKFDNNECSTGLMVLGTKIKVLAIEGSPHWDSKFLMQILRKQPHIDLTTVIRVTSDRFFRIETDRADPIDSQKTVFPDDISELALYDLIIFGKGVEYFLTSTRIQLLKEYVREYGGNILFARAKPYHGSFPELEPIEPIEWGEPLEMQRKLRPTPEGNGLGLFGWMLPSFDHSIWEKMPMVSRVFQCRAIKTFSQVLIDCVVNDNDSAPIPGLISRRYGRGVVVVLNSENLWKWGFFPDSVEINELYEQFWIHLIQWTASYGDFLPGQNFSIRLSKNVAQSGEPVSVIVQKRSPAISAPDPSLEIWHNNTLTQTLQPRLTDDIQGWRTSISLSEPGVYTLKMIPNQEGQTKPLSQMLFIRPPTKEADNLSAHPEFLEEISKLSRGRVVDLDESIRIVMEDEPNEMSAQEESDEWISSWDQKGFLLIVIAFFFCFEWFLRRKNGLI